jgi:hypothetical protein
MSESEPPAPPTSAIEIVEESELVTVTIECTNREPIVVKFTKSEYVDILAAAMREGVPLSRWIIDRALEEARDPKRSLAGTA